MVRVALHVRARPALVWAVIGKRWGDVHRILPSLSASRLVTDGPAGAGSARLCTLREPLYGIRAVEERVLEWREGRGFSYSFDAPPWPMRQIVNRWTIEPDGEGTRLVLEPTLEMRGGVFGNLFAPAVLRMLSRSLEGDLPAMVEAIERECASLKA